jgi:hypothetical protein
MRTKKSQALKATVMYHAARNLRLIKKAAISLSIVVLV